MSALIINVTLTLTVWTVSDSTAVYVSLDTLGTDLLAVSVSTFNKYVYLYNYVRLTATTKENATNFESAS